MALLLGLSHMGARYGGLQAILIAHRVYAIETGQKTLFTPGSPNCMSMTLAIAPAPQGFTGQGHVAQGIIALSNEDLTHDGIDCG